jgi:hypothetical protein
MYVETSHYVAQTGLELVILLPLIPECWDYREMPPPLERHVFIKEVIMHECVVGKNQLRAWAVVWGRQAEVNTLSKGARQQVWHCIWVHFAKFPAPSFFSGVMVDHD